MTSTPTRSRLRRVHINMYLNKYNRPVAVTAAPP
jgi:hypothetical protein